MHPAALVVPFPSAGPLPFFSVCVWCWAQAPRSAGCISSPEGLRHSRAHEACWLPKLRAHFHF